MGMDKAIEKKKWPPKRIITYSSIGLFILVVGYLLIFQAGRSTLNVEKERVTISTVTKGPFQEFIPIIGNVLPHRTIYLDSVIGGSVEKIYLEAGAQVKQGDIILMLSNTNLLMTLLNNEAQINRASNDLRTTRLQLERNRLELKRQRTEGDYFLKRIKRRFERNEIIFKDGYLSKQDFDDLKDEYEFQKKNRELTIESQEKDLKFSEEQVKQLEVSVKQMEASLTLLKAQLENLTVKAPISGHLTSLLAEVGQSKAPGERLGQIDDVTGFKVRAPIDEHYIARVEVGKTGQFDFSDNTFDLKVSKVYPEVRNGQFEVDMEFVGKNAEGIRRGQTLHIRLQLSDISVAILIPRGGFYQTTGGNWIYIMDPSGKYAIKRQIRLGRQNPEFFEVLEGLKPGEQVITSSYENYGDMERLVLK